MCIVSIFHQLVLIGGDGSKHGLREDKGYNGVGGRLEVTERDGCRLRRLEMCVTGLMRMNLSQLDEMNARLVFVHRIQHNLCTSL